MATYSVPNIPYEDFGIKLGEQFKRHRLPVHGAIEITPRCNLRCVHCLIAHCKWETNILNYDEIRQIFDEISEKGCLWLTITGGEPLLRSDFTDIYSYAKKKGMLITLFTNGTLITRPIADFLYLWKPRAVEISLYGATETTYEKVTGIAGSFKRCFRGIELLMERHIPLRLKAVVLTINKHEIVQMEDYARSLGLSFRFDPGIMPRLDKRLDPCTLRLTPEEIVELESSFPERAQGWNDFCQEHFGSYAGDSRYICGAGRHSFFIDSYGNLSRCLASRSRQYDLRKGSFSEAWNVFLPEVIGEKAKAGSRCRRCELISLCGRCPAWAELESGDPDAKVEWLCRLAHLRYSTFGEKLQWLKSEASQAPPPAV